MKLPSIAAIISLTILTALCIWKGVDGTVLIICLEAITGLAGYHIGKAKQS